MFGRTIRRLSLCLCLSLAALPAKALEKALDVLDVTTPYTAQFYVSGDKGNYTGTVWHAHGRERRDFQTSGGGQTVLLRRDTDSAYLMKPSGRWYVGLGFGAVGALAGGFDAMTLERTRLKDETVAGLKATRYKMVGTGPRNSRFDGDAWFSKEGILLRAAGLLTEANGHRSNVETGLSAVKLGRVEERMFELPSGWMGMDLRSVPPEKIKQAIESMRPLLEGR